MADTVAYVHSVEDLVTETLAHLGLTNCGRIDQYPGVWVDPNSTNPRKIAAVGVRLTRGRTMHGFALNIKPDMTYFDSIIPCGITDKSVTSLSREGIDASMAEAVAIVSELAAKNGARKLQSHGRLMENFSKRTQPFLRVKAQEKSQSQLKKAILIPLNL